MLIADDHELYRRGPRAMLRGETDIAVVGEAADAATALARTELLQARCRVDGPEGAWYRQA